MEKKTHTLVLHQGPDIELCFMTWLCFFHHRVREALGIDPLTVRIKFIPSGALRPRDWPGESVLTAPALEAKGYCFLDCGGGGARFDQHSADENVGEERDVAASIDLLVDQIDVLGSDPLLGPIVALISASDRTGLSLCETLQVDSASPFPHVPRDLRSMVVSLNERYPQNPEIVLETFMLAMAGLEYLICELTAAHHDFLGGDVAKWHMNLRAMNFMTVDNAVLGLRHALEDRYSVMPEPERAKTVETNLRRFWGVVEAAWKQREADWQIAEEALGKAERIKIPYRPNPEVPRRLITLCVGYTDAKYFAVAARRKKADVTIQFFSDGRFMVSRRRDEIVFDRVSSLLRRADANKRGGVLIEPSDPAVRNTTSIVEVKGERIPTFYYPSGGFAFGNRFATNPEGLAVSALKPWEVVETVRAALRA